MSHIARRHGRGSVIDAYEQSPSEAVSSEEPITHDCRTVGSVTGKREKMRAHLPKPSPAMVVACLALFVSLTGTGVAVVTALPASSVGTAQLKANAVVSSKVKNRSLKAVDFASGQLPRGPQGAQGSAGAQGEAGLSGLVTVNSAAVDLAPDGTLDATANCPAGDTVVGTGFYGAGADVAFVTSTGYLHDVVQGHFHNGLSWTVIGVYVQAICAKTS